MVVDGWVHTHDGNELVLGHDTTGSLDENTFVWLVIENAWLGNSVIAVVDFNHIIIMVVVVVASSSGRGIGMDLLLFGGFRCRGFGRRAREPGTDRVFERSGRDLVLEVVPFDSNLVLRETASTGLWAAIGSVGLQVQHVIAQWSLPATATAVVIAAACTCRVWWGISIVHGAKSTEL
jgi:hypothetical protein